MSFYDNALGILIMISRTEMFVYEICELQAHSERSGGLNVCDVLLCTNLIRAVCMLVTISRER